VTRIGAVRVGMAALHLGAGRQTKDDRIDHAVGVTCVRKRGDHVEAGEPLARVHARDVDAVQQAVDEVTAAYSVDSEPPPERPLILDVLG
jgi:pyrimidine-nucleoside phosphorylase